MFLGFRGLGFQGLGGFRGSGFRGFGGFKFLASLRLELWAPGLTRRGFLMGTPRK